MVQAKQLWTNLGFYIDSKLETITLPIVNIHEHVGHHYNPNILLFHKGSLLGTVLFVT